MLNSLSELDEEHRRRLDISPLFIGLLGIFAGAIIVATVHCISQTWCSQRRTQSPSNRRQTAQISRVESQSSTSASTSTSTSNSTVQLCPVYRYTKECKEGTCAVCLGEFSEGEELRVLPECAHSFHVPCIDMWLYSHPNCPLCRADTMPPRQHVAVLLPDPSGVPPSELSRII